ncbi:hypothetical protein MTo_02123 [Microcystis aeruginosa NIES-1211]|uniref:Uncharacterized protein n=1 Tax=Microcystis aeruginosa NIES-2519 TaxID=2303981 RepID=A0A5A5REQ6_MICAE|nr:MULTISPECIES: hypothetical protein [Microcystis]CCI32903.1 hypothetical protein MICAI_290006 [Microcystis sp. T1-4]GBL14818.1 hypothetical protein MTo_02123 [Microcystis aeruginosa NIES-1211]GCA71627.1 hypothetical protein MiYa_03169 [Microcystis aeruginosa NIES-2519]GCA85130.1 hypothetical protein MiHa_03108 [Microcystis aeruginosa NIES-2522]GCA89805.1 hypothetical protein MiTa_03158 [Microcystis aeruginosa NIES-4264]
MEHTTDNNHNQQESDNQRQKITRDNKPILNLDPNKTIPYIQEGAKPKNE